MSGQTLVTGGDGYLGRRVAARLLAETSDRLILAVRSADRAELSAKETALRHELAGEDAEANGRLEVIAADLRLPDPFELVDPGGVTGVVHAAARTAFSVSRSVAREVNIEGTHRLGLFARRCPKLERLLVLSTLFTSGRRVGAVAEAPHDGSSGFVNHYEWSKYEAEDWLLEICRDLPLSIARLATIVADDDSGAVTQYNAFHNTAKLFFYGLLSLMPGDPTTRMYFTTADFACRGIAHLMRPEVPTGIYHLAPAPAQTVMLGETIDLLFGVFEADPAFRRRRLLRPRFCDIASFRDLVEASGSLSASPMGQAIGSVAPFAEQMFLPKEFDNSRLRDAWPEYPVSEPRRLVEITCAKLVATRWGRVNTQMPEGSG